MGQGVTHFTQLDCWQKCRELRVFIANTVIPTLPTSDCYRLNDQLLRAARSTTANIAEGFGRFSPLDNARFCGNARGSCHETLDHLITAKDEGLVDDELFEQAKTLADQASRLLSRYIAYLRRFANQGPQNSP